MIADMIAMGVRYKRKRFGLPGIEPQPVPRQFKPAMEPDGNQYLNLTRTSKLRKTADPNPHRPFIHPFSHPHPLH